MKNLLLAIVMVAFTLPACEKAELLPDPDYVSPTEKSLIAGGTPQCIIEIIREIKREPVRNPPARIYKYIYHDKQVYYLSAWCCDIPSTLFSTNCTELCHPDGSIMGNVDPQCADFFEARSSEKLVWADDRKY